MIKKKNLSVKIHLKNCKLCKLLTNSLNLLDMISLLIISYIFANYYIIVKSQPFKC